MNKRIIVIPVTAALVATVFTGCGAGSKTEKQVATTVAPTVAEQKVEKETKEKKSFMRGTKLKDLNLELGFYTVNAKVEEEENKDLILPECKMQVKYGECLVHLNLKDDHYDKLKMNAVTYDKEFDVGNSTFEIPIKMFDKGNKIIVSNSANEEEEPVELHVTFDSASIKLVEKYAEQYDSGKEK